MTLGELAVELIADAREFNNKMTEAAEAVEAAAKRVKRASREVAMVGVELAAMGAEAVHAATKNNPAASQALSELQKSFERIAAEVGMALLPVLRQVTAVVQQVGDWFRSLSPNLKENAARFLAITAAVLLGIGAIGELSGVVAGLSGFVAILGGVLSSGFIIPFTVVVGVIALVIANVVLLRHAWETNFLGIRDVVTAVGAHLMWIWESVKMGISESLGAIATAFTTIFDSAVSAVSSSLTFLLQALDQVLTVAEAVDRATGGHGNLGTGLGGAMHTAISVASSNVSPDALKGAMGSAASSAGNMLAGGRDKVVAAGKAAGGWIADAFKDAAKDAKGWIQDLLKSLGLTGGSSAGISSESLIHGIGRFGAAGANGLQEEMKSQQFNQFLQDTINAKAAAFSAAGVQNPFAQAAASTGTESLRAQFNQEHSTKAVVGPNASINNWTALFTPVFAGFSHWLSDSWLNDAMGKLKDASTSFGDQIATAFEVIGQQLTNGLISAGGLFGETVNAAMKGFQSGGIYGAIASVFATLVEHSKAFQYIVNILNAILQRVADTLGTLVSGIEPMLGATFDFLKTIENVLMPITKALTPTLSAFAPILELLATLFQVLAPVFAIVAKGVQGLAWVLGEVAQGIFDVVQLVGEGIIWILLQLAGIWNGIVSTIASIFDTLAAISISIAGATINPFGFMAGWGASLMGAQISTDGLTQAQATLKGMTYASANATAASTAAQTANAAALDKATESLTNVPEGFKVAMERFNATQAGQGPNVYTGTTPGYDSAGNPIGTGGTGQGTGGGLGNLQMGGGTIGGGTGSSGSGAAVVVNFYGVTTAQQIWSQLQPIMSREMYRRRGSFAGSY